MSTPFDFALGRWAELPSVTAIEEQVREGLMRTGRLQRDRYGVASFHRQALTTQISLPAIFRSNRDLQDPPPSPPTYLRNL